jgi:Mg2+ and Co2+ transporter CorA
MHKEPTNADIVKAFNDHSKEDHKFQEETRETDLHIQDTLRLILERLDSMEKKMEPLLEIYNGFIFGRKALIWTAGTIGAITAIAAAVRFFKI